MKLIFTWIFASVLMTACGSKKSDDAETPAAPATTWTQVSSALATNCMLSGCHSSSDTGNFANCKINFTTSEANYKAAQACTSTANTPAARLQLTSGTLAMPSGGRTIDASTKSMLVNFK